MDRSPPPPAQLHIDLRALAENFRHCQSLSGTEVAGVAKANAYGLGLSPVARTLARAGCSTFFVARLEEGIDLRQLLPQARIFVLDGALPHTIPALIRYRLIPVLSSLPQIEAWASPAQHEAAIHIDTGMNRLGLARDELNSLIADQKRHFAGLAPVLLLSHLACADDPAHVMNHEQLARFRAALARLPNCPASLASTGGILLGKDYAFDLVRPGIGLYGGNPHAPNQISFKPVARLTGHILQIRRVDAGDSVGYAASHKVTRPAQLATVALGYADGLMRALSNQGMAAIQGVKVPIIGRVSMDLVTLDVSRLPRPAQAGDEVEFFGTTISLEDIANQAQTIGYEILTSLGSRLQRHYGEPV